MLSAAIKIAVVVLLVKEIWLLLQVPSISEAVVSFVMAGEVPGTDTTLSPDAMIRLLVVVFVLSTGLIFHKELIRLFRWIFRKPTKTDAPQEVAPVKVAKLKVAKMPIVHPHKAAASVRVAAARQQRLAGIQAKVRSFVLSATQQASRISVQVIIHATRISSTAFRYARNATRYAWRVLVVTYILLSVVAVAAWHWLKPRIHQFDRWIDRKLHQNEHSAAVLAVGRDMRKAFKKWVDEARAYEPENTKTKPADNETDPAA